MAAIFEVRFNYVHKDDRPESISRGEFDNAKTTSAKDTEHAIAKVRASVKKERHDVLDDDGGLTGKTAQNQDIVVHSVHFVSAVDVA